MDLVRKAIEADEEEFRNNADDKTILMRRRKVESFLSKSKLQNISSKDRNRSLFEHFSSDSESDGNITLPSKRRKRHSIHEGLMCSEDCTEQIDENSRGDGSDEVNEIFSSTKFRLANPDGIVYTTSTPQASKHKSQTSKTQRNVLRRFTNKNAPKQPKISFCRSPSPALINEDDSRLQEFIVEDEPCKRKRQATIDFQRHNTQKGKTKLPAVRASKLKQRKVFAETEDDEHFCGNITETQPLNLFRIKIRVNEKYFLISCQNCGELTVDWLANQVVASLFILF